MKKLCLRFAAVLAALCVLSASVSWEGPISLISAYASDMDVVGDDDIEESDEEPVSNAGEAPVLKLITGGASIKEAPGIEAKVFSVSLGASYGTQYTNVSVTGNTVVISFRQAMRPYDHSSASDRLDYAYEPVLYASGASCGPIGAVSGAEGYNDSGSKAAWGLSNHCAVRQNSDGDVTSAQPYDYYKLTSFRYAGGSGSVSAPTYSVYRQVEKYEGPPNFDWCGSSIELVSSGNKIADSVSWSASTSGSNPNMVLEGTITIVNPTRNLTGLGIIQYEDNEGDRYWEYTQQGFLGLSSYVESAGTSKLRLHGNGAAQADTERNVWPGETLPTDVFTKYGYYLKGWSNTADGGNDYPAGTKNSFPTGGSAYKDLYAVWEPIHYSVIFDPNGGQGLIPGMSNLAYDQEYSFPTEGFVNGTKWITGYSQVKDPGPSDKVYAPDDVFKNLTATNYLVITLYAQWGEPRLVRITYNANGGEGEDLTEQYMYGSNYALWSGSGEEASEDREDVYLYRTMITKLPNKSMYFAGETPDITGIGGKAYYSDGSVVDLPDSAFTAPTEAVSVSDTSIAVTVTFEGEEIVSNIPITVEPVSGGVFGSGTENLVISGDYPVGAATEDTGVIELNYNSLTINNGGHLRATNRNSGMIIRVKGDVTINTGGKISNLYAPRTYTDISGLYDYYPASMLTGVKAGSGANGAGAPAGWNFQKSNGGSGMEGRYYGGGYGGGGAGGGCGWNSKSSDGSGRKAGNGGNASDITIDTNIFVGGPANNSGNAGNGSYGGGGGGAGYSNTFYGGGGGNGAGATGGACYGLNSSTTWRGSGSGGGAGNYGGGVVIIYCGGKLTVNGQILCNGSNGGSGGGVSGTGRDWSSRDCYRGAGGGGGGGGRIYLMSYGGTTVNGTLNVNGGLGGGGCNTGGTGAVGTTKREDYSTYKSAQIMAGRGYWN